MVQIVNPSQKVQSKEDPPEEFIDDVNKPLKKVVAISCLMCVICYMLSIALMLAVSVQAGPKEKKQTISSLLMIKMYAVMLLIASLFMPTDNLEESKNRCLKYTKLVFILVSLVTNFTGLSLFMILINYGDNEILAAIVLQILGFVIEGFYFRSAIAAVFSEEGFDFQGQIPYDSSPMFGIV